MNKVSLRLLGLMSCLLLFSFTACSNEADETTASDLGHEAYLTLSFSFPTAGSRTVGNDTEAGLETETAISDVTLYLVDQSNPVSVITIPNSQIEWESGSVKKTRPILIPKAARSRYRLYVVVNTQDGATFSPNALSWDALTGAYSLTTEDACSKLWADNHFVMANRQDEVTATGTDRGGVVVDFDGNYPEDHPLKVDVSLDRLACKVTAQAASDATFAPVGQSFVSSQAIYRIESMTLDGVALMNCANSFNLIQQWESASLATGYPELLLVSPSSDNGYSLSSGYYRRQSDYVGANLMLNTGLAFSTPGQPLYCLENNSPYYTSALTGADLYHPNATPTTKMKGRVTAVIFRVQALLTKGTATTEPIIPDEGEGEWDVNTRAMTRAAAVPVTFYRYKGTLYGNLASLLAANSDLSASDTSVSGLRKQGVSVYEDGYMYYIFWIKDQNYTDGGEHYYAMMRNTHYRLTVKAVDELGDDLPGGHYFNATDPIDLLPSNIQVSVTVKGWDTQDIIHPIE